MDRRINDFAIRSFRDVADGDYITARLACRAGLTYQFLWSSQQAIEKYLKCLLLLHRIPAKDVGHSIHEALQLAGKDLPFSLELREPGLRLIRQLAGFGVYRYLEVSYFIKGYVLAELDVAVFDLRRYCCASLVEASLDSPPSEWRLPGGRLEAILADKKHLARKGLVWQNLCFGARQRTKVKLRRHMEGVNAPLWLYPDMLEEVTRYVHLPGKLRQGYSEHLAKVTAAPSKRSRRRLGRWVLRPACGRGA